MSFLDLTSLQEWQSLSSMSSAAKLYVFLKAKRFQIYVPILTAVTNGTLTKMDPRWAL